MAFPSTLSVKFDLPPARKKLNIYALTSINLSNCMVKYPKCFLLSMGEARKNENPGAAIIRDELRGFGFFPSRAG
jgi:hypothetical protein